MQSSNAPAKLVLPFANAGAKNDIPVDSQIGVTPGAASLVDGFPPLTGTPIESGGVPPSRLDMNGALYEISAIARWVSAGGSFTYDPTFASDTNVGGYPAGAVVLRADGTGFWVNTTNNNTTDPESAGAAAAGWRPGSTTGVTSVTMTSSNVTLTPAQYGRPVIIITGTLTANVSLIFPNIATSWSVINSTTGAYTITARTAAGSGVTVTGATQVVCDATNVTSTAVGYAPLASPVFTGNPTAPTAAQFDNDTSVATTAFVQRALGNLRGFSAYSSSITLTTANVGEAVQLYGSTSGQTLTLPASTGLPPGVSLHIQNISSQPWTIAANGSDVFAWVSAPSASFTLHPGETVVATLQTPGQWLLYGFIRAMGLNLSLIKETIYRTSGTWTADASGRTRIVEVLAVGGGGGGGSASGSNNLGITGGGGGGGSAKWVGVAASPQTITVGAGGAAGSAGGGSSFGTIAVGNGGQGASGYTGGAGGAGSVSAGGSTFDGIRGGSGGNVGTTLTGFTGASGGGSYAGSGAPGSSSNGAQATLPGGGGSGGALGSSGAWSVTGGSGAAGMVIVREYA